MAHAQADTHARQIGETSTQVNDRLLLERFLAHHDEAAFAGLVQRHGRTVWSVCRRVLSHEQDAEDAFQAVFVVLAQKAASIRKGEAVGSWLYGVAYRTAVRARHNASRRKAREQQAPAPQRDQPPWGEAAFRELQRLLDEEVQRLSQKYRAPFVLCCLEGLSKAEAARALGWREGTVSGRLARARQLLQTRLARRGLTLSAALTAGELAQSTAAAAAPASLVHVTARAALTPLTAQGGAGSLSASAAALARDVLHGMSATRVVAALSLFLVVLLFLAGAGLTAYRAAWLPSPVDNVAVVAALPAVADAEEFQVKPRLFPIPDDDGILTLAFSPDGKRLATAGGWRQHLGHLRTWDVATAQQQLALTRLPAVAAVAYSPDGQILAVGEGDGTIKLHDAGTGRLLAAVKGHGGAVNRLAFAPDGASLVSAGGARTSKLWSFPGLQELRSFRGHDDVVLAAAWCRNGAALVTGGKDQTARLWDVRTGAERFTLRGHQGPVEAVAVTPDSRVVATAGWDRTIRLWDATTGQETAVLQGSDAWILAVAFSPDGRLLASAASDGTVRLWDVPTRRTVASLEKHAGAVWSLAFSPDGSLLATGSADATARLWNVATWEEVATLAAADVKPIQALAYAPDGKVVALAHGGSAVEVRDAKTGELLHCLPGHAAAVTCLAFAPGGQTLATGSADATVQVWDRTTGRKRLTLKGHTGAVSALAFDRQGRLASGGADRIVKVWNAASGEMLVTFQGHEGAIRALAFAPHGRRLASGGSDRTIRLWDLDQGKEAVTMEGHEAAVRALAYAPDGLTLASAGEDASVRLWAPSGGPARRTLTGHAGGVWALAFAPDGQTLVSGGQDKAVIVWDARTGRCRSILKGHGKAVTALAYHPRGAHLLSGSLDASVLRWLRGPATMPALTLRGNPAGTCFARYSPTGDCLVSGGEDGAVTLWTPTLAPAHYPLASQPGVYWDGAFAPDGRSVALATNTGVLLGDAFSRQIRRVLAVGQPVRAVAYSPDGKYLAAGTGSANDRTHTSATLLFHVATGQELGTMQKYAGTTLGVRFSPDGKTLAIAAADTIRLCEVPSGTLRATLPVPGRHARGMVFLPSNSLVTAGADGGIHFWDVADARQTNVWQAGLAADTLAVSPDGAMLAAAEGQGAAPIKVWDLPTGRVKATLQGHAGRILALAFTPDGRGLTASGGQWPDLAEMTLWDLPSGRLRARHAGALRPTLFAPQSPWANLAIRDDGRRVVAVTAGGVSRWDLNLMHRERTWTAHAGAATCGLFVDREKTLATGGADGNIKLWDVATGGLRATLAGHRGGVRALALLPDGRTLLSAGEDATIQLWDAAASTAKGTLRGHIQPVSSLAVAPDGKTLVSGGGDSGKPGSGELILWDLESGKPRLTLPGIDGAVWSVAFSPEATLLAAAIASGSVKVWDTATGRLQTTLSVPDVRSVAFSPDGKRLAAGQGKRPSRCIVRLWDTATWHARDTLQGHWDEILDVAFAPDGRALAAASKDGTITLCRVPRVGGSVRSGTALRSQGAGIAARRSAVRGASTSGPPTTAPPVGMEPAPSALPEIDPPAVGPKVWVFLVSAIACILLAFWAARWYVRPDSRPAARAVRRIRNSWWLPVTATLAVLGLAAALGLRGSAGGTDGKPEAGKDAGLLRVDFRGRKFDEELFVPYGVREQIVSEAEGLRITLPGEQLRSGETGIKLRRRVPGDWEITTSYELLKPDQLPKSAAVGAVLYVRTATAAEDAVMLARFSRPTGNAYTCNRMTTEASGKRKITGTRVPTQVRTGKLRLVRRGAVVTYLVADETMDGFRELYQAELGKEDAISIRIFATNAKSDNPVAIRILDFELRTPNVVVGEVLPSAGEREEEGSKKGWLVAAELLALLIVVALVGAWRVWARRRQAPNDVELVASGPVAVEPTGAEAASPRVLVSCPGCGKSLKARPELAGKKIRCPQCGQALRVPGDQSDGSA